VSAGLLDQLGLSALAGFAIGLAVAGNTDDRRTPQQLARDTLAECLRLVEDSRVSAALPAASPAISLPETLTQSTNGTTAPAEEARPRRRRRTRAEIEAAAAPPVSEEAPRTPRGQRPAQQPAPVEETLAAEVGITPVAAQPTRRRGRQSRQATEAPAQPPQEARAPRRQRMQGGEMGNGSVTPFPQSSSATPPVTTEGRTRGADGKVNLNNASRGELMRLPRIGAQAADKIIHLRDQQGRISGVRQLRSAEVLSAAQWKQIRDLVRF
jgi:hypothetical protein